MAELNLNRGTELKADEVMSGLKAMTKSERHVFDILFNHPTSLTVTDIRSMMIQDYVKSITNKHPRSMGTGDYDKFVVSANDEYFTRKEKADKEITALINSGEKGSYLMKKTNRILAKYDFNVPSHETVKRILDNLVQIGFVSSRDTGLKREKEVYFILPKLITLIRSAVARMNDYEKMNFGFPIF